MIQSIKPRVFTVQPQVPNRLNALKKLSFNLWWCWHHDAINILRRVHPDLWNETDQNPVRMLSAVPLERLQELEKDQGFLNQLDKVEASFDSYMKSNAWFDEKHPTVAPLAHHGKPVIAYFSAEFGIHESVPVYSGGLGVLAGDHLKAASDLGIPLAGVGLMYREGYFRQYLTVDGWQQERYPDNDFFHLPMVPVEGPDGKPLIITTGISHFPVKIRIWRMMVGKVPLFLLDTNIEENSPADQDITARLYGGDSDMRVRQEIILGIGGLRALVAMGLAPSVCHMNEGHSAFCNLERIRMALENDPGLSFAEAREAVAAGSVFTTHTPVPAGNDRFGTDLIEKYFHGYYPGLRIGLHDFLALGRENPSDNHEPFCMTVLALKLANVSNGVSALHGQVSRGMWKNLWPGIGANEIPITSITNGIHTTSWLSGEMANLFDRYLGREWQTRPAETAVWKRIDGIPDSELWRTHERRRERLVAYARQRLRRQLLARAASPSEIAAAEDYLHPEALTIGFARRFATYKRGALIFRQIERLTQMLLSKDQPVQLIFAGKAHPHDHGGKELIAEIASIAHRKELKNRVVFLEDYDMNTARYLVQGCDIWLNNPRRPLEASGTSGMKAAANGVLNFSVLDGWWVEGFDGENGWSIGSGEEYGDLNYQDDIESRSIHELLEQEIVPLFYRRGSDGVPKGWVARMKRAIGTLAPVYNTGRMVCEYTDRCYIPSLERHDILAAESMRAGRELAAWRQKVTQSWHGLRIEDHTPPGTALGMGQTMPFKTRIQLGNLLPSDVMVQVCHGPLDSHGEVQSPHTLNLVPTGSFHDGGQAFEGQIPCAASGRFGYRIRVLPNHPHLATPLEPKLVLWG